MVIAIIAVLAGMLIPATRLIMERAKLSTCANNLRQLGLAATQYAGDNEGVLPPHPVDPGSGRHNMRTVATNPAGVWQWVYYGKLVEAGLIDNGRVYYCPTALKGTFDYASQWGALGSGTALPSQIFRIGYWVRVNDTGGTPGRLLISTSSRSILIYDESMLDYSQHPRAKSGPGKYWINLLLGDGRVVCDQSGTYWGAGAADSVYTPWETSL